MWYSIDYFFFLQMDLNMRYDITDLEMENKIFWIKQYKIKIKLKN